jgi:hypothetical protein
MKLLLSLVASLALLGTTPAFAEAVVKEVCHDKVGKDGKPVKDKKGDVVQECKKIKTHKKLEGTEVPEDKKKK